MSKEQKLNEINISQGDQSLTQMMTTSNKSQLKKVSNISQTKKSNDKITRKADAVIKKQLKLTSKDKKKIGMGDRVERQQIILKIQKYQDSKRFGDYVQKKLGIKQNLAQLQKLKIDSLENMLERIRVNLDNKNVDKMYDGIARTCTMTFEKSVSPIYNIDGFTQNLWLNDEFGCVLERYKIEAGLPKINPHVQMLYIVATTIIMTHEFNKMKIKDQGKKIFEKKTNEKKKESDKKVQVI